MENNSISSTATQLEENKPVEIEIKKEGPVKGESIRINNIKPTLLIMCDSAIIDRDTSKISLIGIFEGFKSKSKPAIYPQFTIFTRFENGDGKHSHNVKIRQNNSKNIIAELKGEINFSIKGNAQHVGSFIGLPFPDFGKYTIEVYLDDNDDICIDREFEVINES